MTIINYLDNLFGISYGGEYFHVSKARQLDDWGKNMKKQNKRKQIIILEARTF
jgi:hypothetical protein